MLFAHIVHYKRRTTSAIFSLLVFACSVCSVATLSITLHAQDTTAPIALHPDNPHYFTWQGKPTVLITSAEHYGVLLNTDFDYRRYLDTLAANRLNHTRVFSGVYREIPGSFGITENTLAPLPGKHIAPWAKTDQAAGFAHEKKFDLNRWDEAYFERLHQMMRYAKDRGVVVEFNLFCPMYDDNLWLANPMNSRNNIQGTGNVPKDEVYTLKHAELLEVQRAVTVKLVEELRDYDNLYYEICNEPYFGGVTQEWQNNIADLIAETEKDWEHQHLISMNIANGTQRVERPHPRVSILNFHYCVPPQAVADNYHLNRVIGENETGFRGHADVLYRTEAWDFLLAGGALYNNLDYSFTASHPDGTLADYQSPGGGSPALRKQLEILRDFIEGFDFIQMQPAKSLVQNVSNGMSVYALENVGKQYALYVHVPIDNKEADAGAYDRNEVDVTLKLALPAGDYQLSWIDTKTGATTKATPVRSEGAPITVASPKFVADIGLRVEK